jgi:hypothetical protein
VKEWCGNMINMLSEIDQMHLLLVASQKSVAVRRRGSAGPVED